MNTAIHTPAAALQCFPLIADPATYRPETIDLIDDDASREYWLEVFEHHTPGLAELASASQGHTAEVRRRAVQFARDFLQDLKRIRRDPTIYPDLSIVRLCALRREYLLQQGFEDPYKPLKDRENDGALVMLPPLLAEIDALPEAERLTVLMEDIFAGNVFDMGSRETIELYKKGEADFHATRQRLAGKRPWLVDGLDALRARFAGPPHRKAILFVDNAGADIALGMIPFARFLLQRGTRVVLASNTGPALNDIIHPELIEFIDRIAKFDPIIAVARSGGALTMIASGCNLPVMDMRKLSPEICDASRDADLLVLEGMGRSLETNYRTRFTIDTLKIAMVKEKIVADVLGGKLYDVVCRFEPA